MISRRLTTASFWFLAVLLLSLSWPVLAVQPDEILKDPVLEGRARVLSKELRCLVCQNQSIDDSDADLARDLRVLLRQRLKAGDSDQQARQYLVDRYGDYVLLNPPFKGGTIVLWVGPAVLLGLALLAAFLFLRRRAAGQTMVEAAAQPLSEQEQRRLDALLKDDKTP
ncbi:MAG TPA: cytochrome c-type biogenesis protein CcmH [Rhodospirillaceae bacterium]|nr:cytochrome c-type biogenesis protein CcmH [Rhodospirillaceae bacterium]